MNALNPPARRRWPAWLVTAGAAVVLAGTLALGQWQLSRAHQKEALQAGIDAQRALDALDNAALAGRKNPVADLHRTVRLRGQWLPEHTVYLDNRPMQGRPGFYVLTPLRLKGMASVVLVQRGWIPRHVVDRTRLSPVETPVGEVVIEGRITAGPSRLYELSSSNAASEPSGSSVIRQNLELSALASRIQGALEPFTVLQTGPASEGLQRNWPEVASTADKHYGYAFQWFGLSALVTILYVWFQFIAPRRAIARSGG